MSSDEVDQHLVGEGGAPPGDGAGPAMQVAAVHSSASAMADPRLALMSSYEIMVFPVLLLSCKNPFAQLCVSCRCKRS